MSVWTHVAGCIRYDDLRCFPTGLREKYRAALSNNVPTGSEGPLQYSFCENPEEASAAAYSVVIWGDLRDYGDLDEIERWLRQCIEVEPFLVRNAIVYAEVESGQRRVWAYVDGVLNEVADFAVTR